MTPHGHSHGPPASARIQKRLAAIVVPLALLTAIALVVLWPGEPQLAQQAGPRPEQVEATVVAVEEHDCEGVARDESFRCVTVEAAVEGTSEPAFFEYAGGRGVRMFEPGDAILLARADPVPPGGTAYYFVDYQRSRPLLLLAALFAAVVIALSRWRGLAALAGLAVSMLVLLKFMIPAILEGSSPIAVAIVGAAAIMFPALYLAHGVNARTTTAVLGTLASLCLTGALAVMFVGAARFTGLASEEASFLQVSADQINLQGLLLGGIIIGALGVLDDVTVTQASAVWELHAANPALRARELYSAALRIGRDHIASTVNTLVLAYVGASLPLMIIFTISNRTLGSVLTTEVIAEEVVRTLVGSVGLVASVPITTALAAVAVAGDADRSVSSPAERSQQDRSLDDLDRSRPRAEREWRA